MLHLIISVFAGIFIGLGFRRIGLQFEELGKIFGAAYALCGIIGAVAGILPLITAVSSSIPDITNGEAFANHVLTTVFIPFYFVGYFLVDGLIGAMSSIAACVVSNIISMIKEESPFSNYYW